MGHLRAVAFEDGAVAVAEVARVNHQGAVAGLDQVSAGRIHRQGARSCDDKGLPIRGKEHLAHALDGLSEGFHEGGRQVTGGGGAHRFEHSRLEFDRPGDH